jgi:hypothetical protein
MAKSFGPRARSSATLRPNAGSMTTRPAGCFTSTEAMPYSHGPKSSCSTPSKSVRWSRSCISTHTSTGFAGSFDGATSVASGR